MLTAADRERDTTLASQAAALEAKLAKMKQQMADTLAELGDEDGPNEPPAAPEPSGQRQGGPEGIFTSVEEAATAAGHIAIVALGSPEHTCDYGNSSA